MAAALTVMFAMTMVALVEEATVVEGPSMSVLHIVEESEIVPSDLTYGEFDAHETQSDILQLKRAILYLSNELEFVYMHTCMCFTFLLVTLVTFVCCSTCRKKTQRPLTTVLVEPPPHIEPLQLQHPVKV